MDAISSFVKEMCRHILVRLEIKDLFFVNVTLINQELGPKAAFRKLKQIKVSITFNTLTAIRQILG